MRWWFLSLVAVAALAATFRLALPTVALEAAEVDTLAAGAALADQLAAEGPTRARLVKGFAAVERQPRAKLLTGGSAWRAFATQAPLPRWLAGGGIAWLSAEGGVDLDGARGAAALAVALALALFAWAAGRGAWRVALLAGVLALLQPGLLDAATGSGYAAAGVVAMAALLAALRRTERSGAGGVALGAAWGLTLAVHPGALFLIVPIYVGVAIARGSGEDHAGRGGARGELAMPAVGPSVYLVPMVGAVVLVALWPSLWEQTGKGLSAWFTEAWRQAAPAQAVAGVTFDQAADRAPQAWTALLQWASFTPLPLLLAWLGGVLATIRSGRQGDWAPILLLVTVLLVGAVDGGLFGARMTLLPLTWLPTAATAAVGVTIALRWLAGRLDGARRHASRVALLALVVVVPAVTLALGATPRGGHAAVEARLPLPLALIRRVARETPGTTIAIAGGGDAWRRSFEVIWGHVGLQLHFRPPEKARWVLGVDDPTVRGAGPLPGSLGPEPTFSGVAGGAAFAAYASR